MAKARHFMDKMKIENIMELAEECIWRGAPDLQSRARHAPTLYIVPIPLDDSDRR